jgi:peroxiredoxin
MMLLAAATAHAAPVPGPDVHLGDSARLFSLPALNEEAAMRAVARPHVALSDFTGVSPAWPARAVVLHFMRREGGDGQLAALQRLQKRLGGKGTRTLAVVVEGGDIASLSAWVHGQRLDFPVLNDVFRVVSDRYGIKHFPTTFVVDDLGYVQAMGVGNETMDSALEPILAPMIGG